MSQIDAIGSQPSSVDKPVTVGKKQRAGEPSVRPAIMFAVLYAMTLMATIATVLFEPVIGRTVMAMVVVAIVAVFSLINWAIFVRPGGRARLVARAIEDSERGHVIVDGEDRPIYANRAYITNFAANGAGDNGKPPAVATLFADDAVRERERLSLMARMARKTGRASQLFRIGDGNDMRWARISARGYGAGEDGVIWGIEDLTGDLTGVFDLDDAEQKLRTFVEGSSTGYGFTDMDGHLQFANRTLADWLGHAHDSLDLSAVELSRLLNWPPAAASSNDEDAGHRTGLAHLQLPDGASMPVAVTEKPVPGADGKPLRRAFSLTDRTQEAALEATLAHLEDQFVEFFEYAPVGIVMLEADGAIAGSNALFRTMLAIEDDPTGRPWIDVLHADDVEDVRSLLADAAGDAGNQTETHVSPPVELRFGASRERAAQLYATRLGDGQGGDQFLLHLIDTTEQKDLEIRFFQSQKMQAVGQLAGGVAHDFNNLLTAMIGFCDLLLMRHPAGDSSYSDIVHIRQNANRAANLIRQLLAFSRQQTLRPKVLMVTDVLAELSNLLRRLIGENIELRIVHGRDLWPVKVDQGQLEQVIINLAVNARDAMPGSGTLTIRTANVTAEESERLGHDLMPSGDYTLIEVADTGHGIPKENIGKIYEPFFTTKEVGAGTGLGLSTVYGIIKQTGGNIWVDSELDKGSTFKIYLPTHVAAEGEAEKADEQIEVQAAVDLTGRDTILLVEDEDAVRMFATRALQNKGYTVLEADNGESALEVIRQHDGHIELMISDVVMPNMDGPTLVGHARVERPNMKIIFISGYAEDAFRKNMSTEAQEIEFLPKPFSLKQLATKVKDVIGA